MTLFVSFSKTSFIRLYSQNRKKWENRY